MAIRIKQLDQTELAAAVLAAITGTNFSGLLTDYIVNSGWLGNTVLYITGDQSINGTKTFTLAPLLPYTGSTGSAAQRQWTFDQINAGLLSLSGSNYNNFVSSTGNDTIFGYKTFTGAVGGGNPINPGDLTTKLYVDTLSGFLSSSSSSTLLQNVVFTSGVQNISGQKIYTISPLVPIPTDASGAVPLSMLAGITVLNAVGLTGNDTISGIKTFLQSPIIPIATDPNQAVSKMQLDANIASVAIGTGGFAGVASINGTSGSSGQIYLQGGGTVTVIQCANVFTISGNTANNTQLYSARIPIPSGITGITYNFGSGFATLPTINATLEVTGAGRVGFMRSTPYGTTVSGFNIAFESGIPSSFYILNINAVPFTSGLSGFFGIQGQQGNPATSLNSRGAWITNAIYNPLDFTFVTDNMVSYVCNTTHISNLINKPTSTGNVYWSLLASGQQGATGSWIYQGNFNTGVIYRQNYSTFYNDESYGFTGSSPISGILPNTLTGGWTYIARRGNPGYFINSGIITGNFVNISFFVDPVQTGLALAEGFVSRNFFLTGYSLGVVQSGIASYDGFSILTGRLYTRNQDNSQNYFQTFTLNTGVYFTSSGNMSVLVSGQQRLGFDILNLISGISKLSVGLFGFGTG